MEKGIKKQHGHGWLADSLGWIICSDEAPTQCLADEEIISGVMHSSDCEKKKAEVGNYSNYLPLVSESSDKTN